MNLFHLAIYIWFCLFLVSSYIRVANVAFLENSTAVSVDMVGPDEQVILIGPEMGQVCPCVSFPLSLPPSPPPP